jgi:thiamine pyrophosphate-dependent acetolactate synthase large subunit-like protein
MLYHEVFARSLVDAGVTTMFGQMGDANLYMVDNYVHQQGGRYVAAANEFGAMLMALGYAHRSGKVGVVTITHGPALTNLLTPLVEGVRDRVPVVLLAGDTSLSVRNHPQDIAQQAVIATSGAGFEHSGSAKTIQRDLAIALRRAAVERRPIALNLPTEYTWQDIEYGPMPVLPALAPSTRPDTDALDAALGVLASARRPLVLLGHGIAPADRSVVLRLAERIGAPVATTLKGKGSVGNEPFALGVCGAFASAYGNETILASDCIVAFGASLNRFTTAEGSLVKDTAVVHCDVDATAIGLHMTPTVGVVGDAGATATGMLELIEAAEIPPAEFRAAVVAQHEQHRDPFGGYQDRSTDRTVDVRTALRRINTAVPSRRTVVMDGGRNMGQPFKLIDAYDPAAWLYLLGFGSIGLGTGAAIGAAVGAPDEPTLLVTGDGGFMSGGLHEFHTAVREGLDLIAVIANDGAYGAEHVHFRDHGMDPSLSTFDWPDFAPVAEALGARGVTVRCLADLDIAERAIADRDRPLLIDLKLDPDEVPPLL